ncbi:hypothetical protein BpHYR1_033062 [Brachionus plicatilis]|uniref:Uncharacterized protein n=1 Tax=Brachionus plicatilis TaxID=10195 RepID=A0A3M7RI68_BRAPC|nr:hypothetical protein BpHYR1_033062 [Brachionus plicatilis]
MIVHFDDIGELVRQIVLGTGSAVHDDRGPDAQRRHRYHSAYHPVGPGVLRVHAHEKGLVVGDPLEYLEYELGRHVHFFFLRCVVGLLPLGGELEALAPYLRLIAAASARYCRRVLLGGLVARVVAKPLCLAQIVHVLKPLFGLQMHLLVDFVHARVIRVDQQLGTVEADAAQHLDYLGHEADVEYGLG